MTCTGDNKNEASSNSSNVSNSSSSPPFSSSPSLSPRPEKKWKTGVLLLLLGIFKFASRLFRPGTPMPSSEPSPPPADFMSKFYNNQSPGQSRTRKASRSGGAKVSEHASIVTFADVVGVDGAKEELEEIVDFLRNPVKYIRLGARPLRGVLLVGLPGTGKSLLEKTVTGEANVPFISCSASEFVEIYVGMGASRVRDLFARAKKEAPSIIFIDEIDAVAKSRDGRFRIVSNDERKQTLNQLLTEMDGFDSNSTIIVLAATNHSDVLDPPLHRPGRFDRVAMVEAPDRLGREAILKVHVNKMELSLGENKLSILPRSYGALGFTYIPPTTEDQYLLFVDELRGRLVTLLGGHVAEVVYFGHSSMV